MDTKSICEHIQQMAELEGTEIGEYWSSIACLGSFMEPASEEFLDAWNKEVERIHQDILENWEVVEEQYLPNAVKIKSLVPREG